MQLVWPWNSVPLDSFMCFFRFGNCRCPWRIYATCLAKIRLNVPIRVDNFIENSELDLHRDTSEIAVEMDRPTQRRTYVCICVYQFVRKRDKIRWKLERLIKFWILINLFGRALNQLMALTWNMNYGGCLPRFATRLKQEPRTLSLWIINYFFVGLSDFSLPFSVVSVPQDMSCFFFLTVLCVCLCVCVSTFLSFFWIDGERGGGGGKGVTGIYNIFFDSSGGSCLQWSFRWWLLRF